MRWSNGLLGVESNGNPNAKNSRSSATGRGARYGNCRRDGPDQREQVVKANPFLEHLTVADLKIWADRKMRGPELHLAKVFAADGKN
jgi:hypothetical protein